MSLLRTSRFRPVTITSSRAHAIFPIGLASQRRMQISDSTRKPILSRGSDEAMVLQDAGDLIHPNGKWQLTDDAKGLERVFKFKTFNKTWDFMNLVAEECKNQRHHPEWTNIYNKAQIRWTTHNPSGLSGKDVFMARFCDERAVELGEIVDHVDLPRSSEQHSGGLGKLEAGDCCTPKG